MRTLIYRIEEVPISNPGETSTPASASETPVIPVQGAASEGGALPPAGSRLEEFAKTGTAARMSGSYNETAGYFKRMFGELTDDSRLKEAGRNQQLLGKVHRLVGTVRDTREAAVGRIKSVREESQAILRKHGGRALDVASDLVDDMKKAFIRK